MEDSVLVEEFIKGDSAVFDDLMQRNSDVVYRVCYYMTGDQSLAQVILDKTFKLLKSNLKKDFSPDKDFSYYLYKNTVISLKSELNDAVLPNDSAFPGALIQSLSSLSFDQRCMVVLKEIEKLSYFEISAVLGISKEKVGTGLSGARFKLRDLLLNMKAL